MPQLGGATIENPTGLDGQPKTVEDQFEGAEIKDEAIDIKFENTGPVPLTVDGVAIADFLKYWGFSTKEINQFHIVFRAGETDYPEPGDKVMGFYQKREGSDYIEVFTTVPVTDQEGNVSEKRLSEEEIRDTLLHELWHAVQKRMEKLDDSSTPAPDHPVEKDADRWATANVEKYQSMLSCTEIKSEVDGEQLNSAEKVGSGSKESSLIPDSEHPARDWAEKMDAITGQYENGTITIQEAVRMYAELFDRGRNMAKSAEGQISESAIEDKAENVKRNILSAAEERGKKAA